MFYHHSDTGNVNYAMVVDAQNTFLGGFLGEEADRKLTAFRQLPSTFTIENQVFPNMEMINFIPFSEKLGAASPLFLNSKFITINDREDCNGTMSNAESCESRQHYYKAVGLGHVFMTYRKFPVWAFIANHIAVFGVNNFHSTFFRGADSYKKGLVVYTSEYTTRYSRKYMDDCNYVLFQAPAAYVRALVHSKVEDIPV